MGSLRINVTNIGPVVEADIKLKPLTIFVGSNNSGKSYIAQLIYATVKSFKSSERYMYYPRFSTKDKINKEQRQIILSRFPLTMKDIQKEGPLKYDIKFDLLPKMIAEECELFLQKFYSSGIVTSFSKEIERCYGAKLSELTSKFDEKRSLKLKIIAENPNMEIIYSQSGRFLQVNQIKSDLRNHSYQFSIGSELKRRYMFEQERLGVSSIIDNFSSFLLNLIVVYCTESTIDIFPNNAYYLPAARSGILQGQRAIARAGLQTLGRAGIEAISIPKLPGVIIDFIDAIYKIDKESRGPFFSIGRELENTLARGKVEVLSYKQELPEIYFREAVAGRLPLHRTSSMVSELAPVVLFLKYIIRKNDLIIIEEPESHLHPAAQLEFAKVIIRLVSKGVKVILTTHSDYMLNKLSNIIVNGSKPKQLRMDLGLSADNYIDKEWVSAYLFKRENASLPTKLSDLRVNENGISDTDFGEVAEELYNEALKLRRVSK
jgi:predicted ATPase